MSLPPDIVLMAFEGAAPALKKLMRLVLTMSDVVEEVKVYQQHCKEIAFRSREILFALRDATHGLEGTRVIEFADEAEMTLSRIYNRVQEWASYNRVKSFLQHSEVKRGIDQSHQELDSCIVKLNISVNLDLARGQRDLVAIQERDRTEIRDILQTIARNMGDLNEILKQPAQTVVEEIMQGFQEELHDPKLARAQEQIFKRGLLVLHEESDVLPPLVDLTGQVSRISDRPVASGAFNDIYTGEWLDSEMVALRLPRALGNESKVYEHFQKEVAIWKSLRHPNVTPLYGTIRFQERTYSVSPWMEHKDAMVYLSKHPDADRNQILLEVAYGMEHLHENRVVHGDVRGSNVLITKDGVAQLADFGLSKFLEEGGHGITCPPGVNPRWFAPEIIEQSQPLSKPSDVWSFGMLALELMTGEQPYSHIPREVTVSFAIVNGELPRRPGRSAESKGLSANLWDLMQRCWQKSPEDRPSMAEIRLCLEQIRTEQRDAPMKLEPRLSLMRQNSGSSHTSYVSIQSSLPSPPPNVNPKTPATKRSTTETFNDILRRERSHSSVKTDARSEISTESKSSKFLKFLPSIGKRRRPTTATSARSNSSGDTLGPIAERIFSTSPTSEEIPEVQFLPPHPNNPTIECGTVDDCIDRLIKSSSHSSLDHKYREIFLCTYMMFTTSTELFEGLDSRFEDAGTIDEAQLRSTTRYNIVFIMKTWVMGGYVSDNSDIFVQIRAKAHQIVESRHVADTILRLAKEICQYLDSMELQESTLLQTPDTQNLSKPSELGAKDIALALTAIEGKNFERLRQADYIIHLLQLSNSDSVQVAIATNERVQYWAMRAILRAKPLDSRVATLKFFIDVAHECRELCNFASMGAIVKGLTSDFVQRLSQTWRDVPEDHVTMMREMAQILEPDRYHQLLRDGDGRCIPLLDVHLRDVDDALSRHPAVVHVGNKELVNFSRCVDVASQLHKLKQFLVPDEGCEPRKVTYVRVQLHRIPTGASADAELETLCANLEAAEKTHEQMRVREWQALGLRMPDQSSKTARRSIRS